MLREYNKEVILAWLRVSGLEVEEEVLLSPAPASLTSVEERLSPLDRQLSDVTSGRSVLGASTFSPLFWLPKYMW